jgi:hypothetical protein
MSSLPIASSNGKPQGPACVNLRDTFGDRFKIAYDPAYDPTHIALDRRDAWMMVLPCERGTIFPHGGQMLAVEVTYAMSRRLDALGLVLHQDGDRERTYLFPVSRFDDVAAVVKPRKRRRLTPEQNAKLQAANAGAGAAALTRWRERSIAQGVPEGAARRQSA